MKKPADSPLFLVAGETVEYDCSESWPVAFFADRESARWAASRLNEMAADLRADGYEEDALDKLKKADPGCKGENWSPPKYTAVEVPPGHLLLQALANEPRPPRDVIAEVHSAIDLLEDQISKAGLE